MWPSYFNGQALQNRLNEMDLVKPTLDLIPKIVWKYVMEFFWMMDIDTRHK